MDSMFGSAAGLLAMVFLLGMRHGIDPDHLATIDGITRFNAATRPVVSRWSGALFSIGHGVVVTVIALVIASTAHRWSPPGWVDDLGTWISIVFLTALGIANLSAVLRAAPGRPTALVGLRSRWFPALMRTSHPIVIVGIGAAFALSFDTMSQAAVFSLMASDLTRSDGIVLPLALSLGFTAGMMATDGINGFCVSRVLQQTDRRQALLSKLIGLTLAMSSLAMAGVGAARYVAPATLALSDGATLSIGLTLLILGVAGFGAIRMLNRPVRAGLVDREDDRHVA